MASQNLTPATLSIPTYHQYQTAAASQNTPPQAQPVTPIVVIPAPAIGTPPPVHNHNTEYDGERNEKGQRHGTGMLRFNTTPNAFYKGNWVEDKMEGHGEYCWGDGHRYVGSFKNNKQHGLGAYFWPTGGKYFGNWKRDKMNGHGTYTRNDGVVYTGQWKDDHQYGEGLKIIPERVCYGEAKKMTRMCIYRESWTLEKHLTLHKEILKFPDIYNVQKENKKFLDIDIVTIDRTPEEEEQVRNKRKRAEEEEEYEATMNNDEHRPRKKLKLEILS
jgi:hypothetical protein